MKTLVFGVALAVLGASACATAQPASAPEKPSSPLEEAKAVWASADITNYLLRAADSDQSPESGACTWIAEVNDSEVGLRWLARYDRECGERDVTVPALHRQITHMTELENSSSGELIVQWSEIGVPTEISFHPDEGESVSLIIEFDELTDESSVRSRLAAASSAWVESGISNYELVSSESRNFWFRGCTWTTVVIAGQPTDNTVDPPDGSYCREQPWTVEDYHRLISKLADEIDENVTLGFDGHRLEVVFDERGMPTRIEFDLSNGADEEMIRVISLTEHND